MRSDNKRSARRGRRGECVVAREARNLRSENEEQLKSGDPLRPRLLMRDRNGRIVTMVHPHAGGRRFRNLGVVEILCELVAVSIGADRDGQREKREDVRLEELANCELYRGISRKRQGRALNVLSTNRCDGEVAVQGILSLSCRKARVLQV